MKKRRVLFSMILFLLFSTLLLWMYWVTLHPDPDLVIIPAGSIDLGLSCFRAFHIRHGGMRRLTFSLLRSEGYGLVLAVRHLVLPLVLRISGNLGGETATPSLFEVITQGVIEFSVWSIAGLLLLRIVLQMLRLLLVQGGGAHP